MMNYLDKTKDDLIKELQKLQQEHDSLKTSYKKEITERKQAEAALKFTRFSLNNAADTMAIIDYDGRFIDVNSAFCRSLGYSREQLLSMTVHDIDPLYPAATWSVFWEKLKQAGSLTFESVHRTKEGKLIPVEINVNFFEYKGKEYHCGFARDITERKRAEEALRESEMKLKTLFEVLPIGVSILDAERNVVFVNPALETILNITKDGFIRGDYKNRKYIRPDGTQMPEKEFASVRAFMEQRTIHDVETGVLMEDGHVIWTNVIAAPVAFPDWKVVIITMDITERKLIEETLRESEDNFKRLYQQAPLGYQSLDTEGCFIDVNQAWLDLLGYSRDQVIGHWFGDFLAPQEVDAFRQRFQCFKTTGEVHVDLEMVQRTGSRIIVHIDGKTGHDENGQFKQTHCILHNITERKRVEEALHLEKENFRHSLDDSPLGVRIVTAEGDTIYANRTILNFYGYDSLGELQRTPLKDRYTPESYAQAQKRKHQRERGDLSATKYEVSIITQNGEIRHLQVFRKEVLWDGVRQFQVIYDDITERKQAEHLLMQQSRDIALINHLNQMLNQGATLEDFERILSKEFKGLFSSNTSSVYLLDSERKHLIIQNLKISKRIIRQIESLIGTSIPSINMPIEGVSLYYRAFREKKALLCNDAEVIRGMIADYARNVPLPEKLRPRLKRVVPKICRIIRTKGIIIVPLLARDEVIGLLEIPKNAPFSDESLRRIETIAGQLTGAILRKKAEEILRESELKVSEALEFNRKILNTSSIGILTFRKSGKCISANLAAAKATGATVPKLLAQNFHEISSWKKSGMYKAAIKSLDTGIEQLLDVHLVTTFGKDVWLTLSFSSFDSEGEQHLLVFITDINKRMQAEEEIRKSTKLLEDLHKHLDEIRENERAMISREIHDQIGQSLTALKLDMNWMDKYIKETNPEATAKLRVMIELVTGTIKDVQRISSELRPGILDDLGLAAAIEWYSDEFEKRTAIKCSLNLDDSIFSDPRKNLVFFRVLQEALTNVIRHANASSVTIKLHQTQKGTTLTIQDNGIGITAEMIESTKALGLMGMRERVRQFNGKVDVSSKKGEGTKLTIFIPSK